MNNLKLRIENALRKDTETSQTLRNMIAEYEKQYPKDFDLHGIKARYCMSVGKLEEARIIVEAAVRRNPYNWEINFVAREVCERMGCLEDAIKYEAILELFRAFLSESPIYEKHVDMLVQKLEEQYNGIIALGDAAEIHCCSRQLEYIKNNLDTTFGFFDLTYRNAKQLIGTYYQNVNGKRVYNAIYNDVGIEDYVPDNCKSAFDNSFATKLECREVVETKSFTVEADTECLLPVLLREKGEKYVFVSPSGREVVCRNKKANHFDYYRVPAETRIESERMLYIGKPIPIKNDPEKKRLVLNIFLDGFSQKVIEEEDFDKIMPLTAAFFSKGIKCQNVYTAAEWTLPSVATYMTGLSSANHMLIHDEITKVIPEDVTILAEYFREQGYQTSKIDGDWRSTQAYGYGRGMDRIIYQHQCIGMRAEQVVADVMDHIELMQETNQFIWMCIGDLHDVADDFPLKASTQAAIPLECCADEGGGYYICKTRIQYQQEA